MHHSSKIGTAVVAVALAIGGAAVPFSALADQPAATETGAADIVTGSGTIQKIDKASREVTIKGDRGNTLDVVVGQSVNLDKLKVGDKVNAAYYEEVAVALQKPGETPKMSSTTTERGGVTARQTTVTAKIVSVDTANNSVLLRGPRGMDHTVKIQDPDLQSQLKKWKAGDDVLVTYTQAVAVSVEPATK